MENKGYYLGLDMGTSTVGWAVTDMQYNLIRKKGKDLWGVREFEEASTAEERRGFRVSRRRRQREQVRINLVRSYFAEAIENVDPNFFGRLDNSKYHLEDKDPNVRTVNGVFNDSDYQDKDYYRDYPTIFHLRKALLKNTDSPYDVRLVYLAIVNMFKHRGHFLNSSLGDEDEIVSFDIAYSNFAVLAEDLLGDHYNSTDADKIGAILADRSISKVIKTEKLESLLGINKKQKVMIECCKAICGRSVDVTKIFNDLEIEEKTTFSFSDFEEDKAEIILKAVGEERYQLIVAMKAIYDASILTEILNGNEYLSYARVESYEKHKQDLKVLKTVIRKYGNEKAYDQMFRSDAPGSYSAYVNSNNTGKVRRRDLKNRTLADFYDSVKTQLKNVSDDCCDKAYILKEIENETFMPKQLTSSNGVIPNQVHARELKAILKNASKYLPFLNDIDESGLTISERIIKLFTFQVPYYVGPVTERSEEYGGNGWVVRKEPGAVLPWNIDSKIDMNETRSRFISRLIRDCTYINGEKVLPKSSLLYERFCVLNEINNLKIDGNRIPVNYKQDVYNDLFKKGKKVTRNQLFEYLRTRGVITTKEQLSGIDITINNYLSSYGKFTGILGDIVDTDDGRAMAEEIIYLCTIYGDSRNFLKEQIKSRFPALTDQQVKRIAGIKFKDWGRLSKEFLELPGVEKETGEVMNLIGAMWETNYNLMELIHSDMFTFGNELETRKTKVLSSLAEITPEALNEFCFSAPVKKMINQTVKIIREIESVMGGAPERIFIEMIRSDDEKGDRGRKDSRKKQLISLFKNVKDEEKDWNALIEREDRSGRLRSKKMFLYITQMGRDMYTGKPIELEDLFDDNLYDIDHIYPRHFVKDDSIHNNLVLVNKSANARKSDEYPLGSAIRTNPVVLAHWKYLKDKNLITEEKYHRLTSNKAFTDDQKADFIARQLVETGQGTKGIADFLKQVLPDTDIVYSKASNVSDFRNQFGFPKSRLINDFHHANDAYLNIVVGNVYYTKFTRDPRNYIRKEYLNDIENGDYNLSKMFAWDVKRNGATAWIANKKDDPGTIATVRKMMSKNTPLMTRQSFTGHGGIADQTLYSKTKAAGVGYIPLKTSDDPKMKDVKKYGGFSKASTAYFCLVEHTVKGKRERTIEAVPIYLVDKVKKDKTLLTEYFAGLGMVDCDVRLERIPLQSLIRLNGFDVHISGKTGNQLILRNAVNLCLSHEWANYIKKLENFKENRRLANVISPEMNIKLYGELTEKHTQSIYARRQNPIGAKLKKGTDSFKKLTVGEQCDVLVQILRISAIGADSQADLRKLGESEHTGVMLMSKKINKYSQCTLINSTTLGLVSQEIDLLTV